MTVAIYIFAAGVLVGGVWLLRKITQELSREEPVRYYGRLPLRRSHRRKRGW